MPELVQLHADWKDKGVRVQTVALDLATHGKESAEALGTFAFKREMFLPVLAYTGAVEDLATFGLTGSIPFTFVVNADGKVVDKILGSADKERFEQAIHKAIDG